MNKFEKGGPRKEGGGGYGGRSNIGGPKFGGNKFGGSRDGGNRPGGRMELFPAICADCGKKCEVPFRPSGERPVYCRDCFGKQPQVPGRNSNGQDGPRQDYRPAPFDPAQGKPQQYSSPRPVGSGQAGPSQSDPGFEALHRQITALESKVNRILELVSQKPIVVPAPVAESVVVKAVKPKIVKKAVKGKK